MAKIILHIDLNAFFVRCEEIKNPALIGKVVIIGHSGRGGIVSTCSYEARKYGIHSGMPTFKALALYPNAIIIGGDYHYYEEMSHKFFSFIRRYTKVVEPASIDECFADFTDVLKSENDVEGFLKKMQENLYIETGLKCSIGVAPTKFLAKMGSDMKKPMGITIIRRKDVRKKLDPLPIEDFFGIGKKSAPKLRELGVNTIGDLYKRIESEDPAIQTFFGKFYYQIKDWITGYGSDEVITEFADPKSLGHSKTLMADTNDITLLLPELERLTTECVSEMKRQGKLCANVQITLKDTMFKSITRSHKLEKPTDEFDTILALANKLLEENLKDRNVRLIGVTMQNLIDKDEVIEQLTIFDDFERIEEEEATKLLVNKLNRKVRGDIFKTAKDKLLEDKYGSK